MMPAAAQVSREAPPAGAAPAAPGPQNADALERVVLAGTKLMYDPKVFPMFAQALEAGGPLPDMLAEQAVGLLKILMDKSGGTMPKNVLIPAAVALMLEMGDFIIKAGLAKPSDADMQAAVRMVIELVMRAFGGQGGAAPAGGGAPAPASGGVMAAPAAQPAPAAGGMIGG